MNEFDARRLGNEYQVPVYYILGDSDWVTPYIKAQRFFETIKAQKKICIAIGNSGHMPMLHNTEEFCKAVLSVLK